MAATDADKACGARRLPLHICLTSVMVEKQEYCSTRGFGRTYGPGTPIVQCDEVLDVVVTLLVPRRDVWLFGA